MKKTETVNAPAAIGPYSLYFTSKPARSCVEVSNLPNGALVEIEVISEL